MRKFVFFIYLLISLSQGEQKSFKGDKVYRLTISNEEDFYKVKQFTDDLQLDLWKEARFIGDNVDVRVPLIYQNQFNVFLATSGIESKTFIDDVQALIDIQRKPRPVTRNLEFDYDVYHTFEEITNWMEDIANEYPDLITKQQVGTTFENRDFYSLKVQAGCDANPKIVINCGIHAREWVSPATCMLNVYYLVSRFESDPTINELLNAVTFLFIPSSNPDGYSYTWTEDRLWRKTRSIHGENLCVGTDPNRNWDSNYGGGGSSSSSCSSTYHGPYPFSENCTAAQRNFVGGFQNVQMFVDVHSYSQLWMYPYGYKQESVPNSDTLDKIANDAVDAVYAVHGKVYTPGPHYSTIYQASGITCDFYYDEFDIPCTFITELRDTGRYGFLLPPEQIRDTAEEVFAGLRVMAQAVANGECANK